MRVLPGPPDRLDALRQGLGSMRSWPARRWAVAALAALATALVTGIPTGIVKTGFYTRMTPVTWWDYPFWALTAVLVGLTAATYVRVGPGGVTEGPDRTKRTLGATLLSVFAVGCPICNKLVVAVRSQWCPDVLRTGAAPPRADRGRPAGRRARAAFAVGRCLRYAGGLTVGRGGPAADDPRTRTIMAPSVPRIRKYKAAPMTTFESPPAFASAT